jgi:hypothetical protein
VVAVVDVFGASGEFFGVEHAGLVEVCDSSAFCVDAVDAPVEAGEFGGEQVVVGGGSSAGDGVAAGEEDLRRGQGGADFVEDEGIQGVGSYVAFPAGAVRSGDTHSVAAGVVVDPAGLARCSSVDDGTGSARAEHQSSY